MPGYGGAYHRKKRKRNGWATQRATMQSIPRLTFKPMQLMRRSFVELTCKISFANAMDPAVAGQRKNGIWWYTINTNSIFPIHRQGNINDPNDGTLQSLTATSPSTQIVDTVWQANPGMHAGVTTPTILPEDGLTLAEMRARPRPATYPCIAPGLFEDESSPGYQYSEIAVVGSKVTAHWIPLVSDIDNQRLDGDDPIANQANGMETEESRLFMFPQTQQPGEPYYIGSGSSPNALIGPDSAWANELETIPYVKSRTITGFTTATKFTGPGAATATKLGNGAVLTYAVSPAALHGVRNISDEKSLWSRNTLPIPGSTTNPAAAKFQHPIERDYLTVGICKSLKNTNKRCPPSGKLTLRIEQTLLMREPMSTRTIQVRADGGGAGQPGAGPAAGSNPGGGSFFPGNAFSAGRIGANVAAAAALAANFT